MAVITTVDRELHVGDVGTRIEVTVKDGDDPVDLSPATVIQIIFEKPDRTTVTKTATVSDGPGGIMYYDTEAGDLDQAGRWKVQAYIEIPTWQGHTDVCSFKVYSNL